MDHINSLPVEMLDRILSESDWIAGSFVCQLWYSVAAEIKKRSPYKPLQKRYIRGASSVVPFNKVQWIVEYLKYPTSHIAEYAIRTKRKELLKWAANRELTKITDIPWITQMSFLAVEVGALQLVKWFIKNGVTSPEYCRVAAKNNQIEILEFLENDSQDWPESINFAAQNGNLAIMKWLVTRKNVAITRNTMVRAIRSGCKDVIEYVHESGIDWDVGLSAGAAGNDTTEILKWIVDKGCPMSFRLCIISAACQKREENIKWLTKEKNMVEELYTIIGQPSIYRILSGTPAGPEFAAEKIIYICELIGKYGLNLNPTHDGTCSQALILGNLDLIIYLGIRFPFGMFSDDVRANLTRCPNPKAVEWYLENAPIYKRHIYMLPDNVMRTIICRVGVVSAFVCRRWRAVVNGLTNMSEKNRNTMEHNRAIYLNEIVQEFRSMDAIKWAMDTFKYPWDYLIGCAVCGGNWEAFQYGLENLKPGVNYYRRFIKTVQKMETTSWRPDPLLIIERVIRHKWLSVLPKLISHGYLVTSGSIMAAARHREENVIYYLCDRDASEKSYFIAFMSDPVTVKMFSEYNKSDPDTVDFLISMFIKCMFPFRQNVAKRRMAMEKGIKEMVKRMKKSRKIDEEMQAKMDV
jgi:hypothetical protein